MSLSAHTSVERFAQGGGAAPGTPVRKTTAVNEPLPPAPAGSHVVSVSETLLPPPPTPAPKVTTWMSQEGRPAAPNYAQPQPQYAQPQPQYAQAQYAQPQYAQPQYAQPQYAPAQLASLASLPAPAVRTPVQCPVAAPAPAFAATPVCVPAPMMAMAPSAVMAPAPAPLPVMAATQLQAPQGLQGLVAEMRARVDTTFVLQAQYHLHRHTSNWNR